VKRFTARVAPLCNPAPGLQLMAAKRIVEVASLAASSFSDRPAADGGSIESSSLRSAQFAAKFAADHCAKMVREFANREACYRFATDEACV
jgi:hypothetical protein